MKNELGLSTAKGHRQMQLALNDRRMPVWMDSTNDTVRYWSGSASRLLPYIEDGSRLAPMHRFHDPDGALFATLPQWPRMNSKLRAVCSGGTALSCPKAMLLTTPLRHNPAGIRAHIQNTQARLALRSRLRPRHYRASLCSDAAAFRLAAGTSSGRLGIPTTVNGNG